ncbi:MAG: TIGR04086 family membrane protein [Clostridia bacterium]|nr:TIGR04086 family membrane protein [Clostridia bacterium]
MEKTASYNVGDKGFIKTVIKGALIALSISLVSICVFAFLLRFFEISADLIKPINQIIKIISVLIGTFMSLKNIKEMGLITGFFIGVLYSFLAFLIFSILNGSISFNPSLLNDILFVGISGAIAGVFAVNIFGKRK